MAVSDYITTRHIEAVFRNEAEIIFSEQSKAVIREGLQIRSGNLRRSLQRRNFFVKDIAGGKRLTMFYLPYTRFLDMKTVSLKRRKQYQIYNKIIFGRIYRKMYVKIMYGFTKDILREMKTQVLGKK